MKSDDDKIDPMLSPLLGLRIQNAIHCGRNDFLEGRSPLVRVSLESVVRCAYGFGYHRAAFVMAMLEVGKSEENMADVVNDEQIARISDAQLFATRDAKTLKIPNDFGEDDSLERLAYLARFYEARLNRRVAAGMKGGG